MPQLKQHICFLEKANVEVQKLKKAVQLMFPAATSSEISLLLKVECLKKIPKLFNNPEQRLKMLIPFANMVKNIHNKVTYIDCDGDVFESNPTKVRVLDKVCRGINPNIDHTKQIMRVIQGRYPDEIQKKLDEKALAAQQRWLRSDDYQQWKREDEARQKMLASLHPDERDCHQGLTSENCLQKMEKWQAAVDARIGRQGKRITSIAADLDLDDGQSVDIEVGE